MADEITTIYGPRSPKAVEFREKWNAAVERAHVEGVAEETYTLPLFDEYANG